MTGTFYIISAPSGAGKTSIIDAILRDLPEMHLSVSHTTRPPREGERDGEAYHFVSEDRFIALENSGHFLESARVFSALYGTSKETVERVLASDQDVMLEIDWQGALQVKKRFPQACWIFILPPSMQALEDRLHARKKDSAATIASRMAQAHTEIQHCGDSDFLIVNEDFEQACSDLLAIVRSHRLRTVAQQKKCAELLKSLI